MGSQNLASYDYAANNGPLETMNYGNGDSVEYVYDYLGRVTVEQHLNAAGTVTATYQYFYNSEGVLAKKLDIGTGKAVNYEYDSLGRLIHSWETSGSTIEQKTEHIYDTSNRISSQSWMLGSDLYQAAYSYQASDGALTYVDSVNGKYGDYAFSYDALKRLSARWNYYFRQDYAYKTTGSTTTNQIETIDYTKGVGGASFSEFSLNYVYDNLGNIKTITGTDITGQDATYEYDIQGQLTQATTSGGTRKYVYDTYGNIREVQDASGNALHTYTYDNSNWKDLLTTYDGQTITYDAIGNPTSYYNGTRWTMSWKNGRQLASASDGTTTVTYTYDQDGIRDSKKVGDVVYNYITQNGKVVRQTWDGNTFDVIYDNSGLPYACRYNNTYYIYVLNLQGDVIRIVNTTGATMTEYKYDAWGNILSITKTAQDTNDISNVNPIRYRGYFYDTETGFYYLQSRYYDPSIGRFINSDSFASTGQGFLGYNMFAYCCNNPICMSDSKGNWPEWLEELGSRFVNTMKFMGRTAISPFKALSAEIGIGLGIGAKAPVVVDNTPVEIGAITAVTDSLSYEEGEFDTRNATYTTIGINIAEVFDFSHTNGRDHSYFDERCTCSFMSSTYGEKSNCPAHQCRVSNDAALAVSFGGYLLIGGEVTISIDFAAWEKELYSIYQESSSYGR